MIGENISLDIMCLCIYSDASKVMPLMKGDLIVLDREVGSTIAAGSMSGSDAKSTAAAASGPQMGSWLTGRNLRSSQKGEFSLDFVYILPTMTEPPVEIIV